mmetsp:Transcript_5085/g.14412  ORF Transcript_5085/g.14412 Transcript_5085/m.14412 type:complete len:312 (-) Transcript_5085:1129-2064(-)
MRDERVMAVYNPVDLPRGLKPCQVVILHTDRHVKHRHSLVANKLQQRAGLLLDRLGDEVPDGRQQIDDLVRLEADAHLVKLHDVAKQNGNVTLVDADARLDSRAEEPLHYHWGHEHGPTADGALHRLEGRLQMAELLHRLDDHPTRHVLVHCQELQGRQGLHVVHQPSQRLQDRPGEARDLPIQDEDETQQQKEHGYRRDDGPHGVLVHPARHVQQRKAPYPAKVRRRAEVGRAADQADGIHVCGPDTRGPDLLIHHIDRRVSRCVGVAGVAAAALEGLAVEVQEEHTSSVPEGVDLAAQIVEVQGAEPRL